LTPAFLHLVVVCNFATHAQSLDFLFTNKFRGESLHSDAGELDGDGVGGLDGDGVGGLNGDGVGGLGSHPPYNVHMLNKSLGKELRLGTTSFKSSALVMPNH